jgi:hypothetical protein
MLTVAHYEVGPPLRPPIHHDNGFLDRFAPRAPTWADRVRYAEWAALLEAAEAGQRVPLIPHHDLPDALAAYRHFLYGKGADRQFSYERYVTSDISGKTTLDNAMLDLRRGIEEMAVASPVASRPSFQIRGGPIPCGSGDPDLAELFPYPSTENWQKALRSHVIWLSGIVTLTAVGSQRAYAVSMTLHAEDRYNFNPGAKDINTGIPDAANGVFEVTGLMQQYMNYSTLTRIVRWTGDTVDSPVASRGAGRRDRMPDDNRRAEEPVLT